MQTVVAALAEKCEPYTLPGEWSRIPCDPSFVRFPVGRADALLIEFRELFGREALIASGVVVAHGAQLLWRPELISSLQPLWAMRLSYHEEVLAIVSGNQVLGSRNWIFNLLYHRYSDNGYVRPPKRDFVVVKSIVDFAILQSLRIDSIPCWGLADLSPERLEDLCRALHINIPGRFFSEEDVQRLVFANWNLADLSLSDATDVNNVFQEFIDFRNNLEVPFGDFRIWKPSLKSLDKLLMKLKYIGSNEVGRVLLHSIEGDSQTIVQITTPTKSATEKYLEDLHTLRKASRLYSQLSPPDGESEPIIDSRVRERLEPILRKAFAANDPELRAKYLELAEVTHLSLLAHFGVLGQIGHLAPREETAKASRMASKSIDEYLKLEQRRILIARECEQCARQVNQAKASPHRGSPPHFRPSASCQKQLPH